MKFGLCGVCISAIDRKHLKILDPPNSGSKFFNYKHSFSVVLLVSVDARYKFTVVDIGSYGRNSDGGNFAHSKLGKYLETHLDIPEDKQLAGTSSLAPHVIMGDEAFPLKTYLLRRYPGSPSKEDKEKSFFSYMLSRTRRVVENAFGILSLKFQIYQTTLQSLPANADNIIFAIDSNVMIVC